MQVSRSCARCGARLVVWVETNSGVEPENFCHACQPFRLAKCVCDTHYGCPRHTSGLVNPTFPREDEEGPVPPPSWDQGPNGRRSWRAVAQAVSKKGEG